VHVENCEVLPALSVCVAVIHWPETTLTEVVQPLLEADVVAR
jgi:hypothetical protein